MLYQHLRERRPFPTESLKDLDHRDPARASEPRRFRSREDRSASGPELLDVRVRLTSEWDLPSRSPIALL